MADIDLDPEARGQKEWTKINTNQQTNIHGNDIPHSVYYSATCEGAESESLDPTKCVGACVWPDLSRSGSSNQVSFLTTKFNAHINVEICSSIKIVKYLFKYVYKGYDCANVKLQANGEGLINWDEPSMMRQPRNI